MSFVQGRQIQDASLRIGRNVPAPGASTYIDGIGSDIWASLDIGNEGFREGFSARLTIPALALDDGQSVEFRLQHSDSPNGPFVDTDCVISARVTGAAGLGSPAREVNFCFP